MKKLIPAIIAILIIPFAIACKKGTNSTGTVTNGVARVELTFSPAISYAGQLYLDINSKPTSTSMPIGTLGSISIPSGSSKYISDDFAVTEGQNFVCYFNIDPSSSCINIKSDIYYNGVGVSSKSFDLGTGNCKDGHATSHNAIVK